MGIPNHTRVLALLALCACGAGYDASRAGDSATGAPSNTNTNTVTPPGEVEDDFLALPPAQTDRYVFIANPTRNTVSRVTVDSLAVITTPVGSDPRVVRTTPDGLTAVAFNRGDDSLSLLDVDSLEQRVVGVRDDLNHLVISPDSRWAVLWHDIAAELPGDPPPDGLQSFNEASFVDLQTGEHFGMAVGFDPKDVVFTPNGTLAAVVSDGVLALIDLRARPLLPELIQLSAELEPPPAEEVVLAPTGSFAFVRQFGTTEVLVVDLATRAVTAVPVGDNPTDLDLSPDGKTAAVVTRGSEQLWLLDALDPTRPPTTLPLPAGRSLGSLAYAPTGDEAVLYTTASLVDRYAVWDVATDTITEHGLVKPVSGVAISPTGDGMLVFHPPADAQGADPSDPFFGRYALTMVDLHDHRSNPLLLPAAVVGYSLSDDGHLATFAMEGQRYLELLDFRTLLHTQVSLDSVPVYVGILPDPDPTDADQAMTWVSQEHDLGRISFYDPDSGSLETITGFELNSGIEHE